MPIQAGPRPPSRTSDNRRPSASKSTGPSFVSMLREHSQNETRQIVQTLLAYIGAALAEIAGCFTFWAWLRLDKPVWLLIPGAASLLLFAYLLTLVDSPAAGRAYAAYGGIYIIASLAWLWGVEGLRPDRWDVGGAALCLAGAAVIIAGPR